MEQFVSLVIICVVFIQNCAQSAGFTKETSFCECNKATIDTQVLFHLFRIKTTQSTTAITSIVASLCLQNEVSLVNPADCDSLHESNINILSF